MKRVLTFIVLVGLLVPTAQAAFVLRLTDQLNVANTVTVVDGDFDGLINYSGPVGTSTWAINITAGFSKPTIGGVATPKLDLLTGNLSTLGAGQLLVELTDTDFILPTMGANAQLLSEIGGTAGGTVLFDQYLDRANKEFGYGDYVVNQGPFGPGAFSGTLMGITPVADTVPFSITEWVLITHSGNALTSLDASSTVVPLPGAVLLGMLGLSAAGIKLRRYV